MIEAKIKEVYLALHSVDFRKQHQRLLAEVYKMELDPYRGECVIFINRQKTKIKALVGDEFGLILITRVFEGGPMQTLIERMQEPGFIDLTYNELALLLDGARYDIYEQPKKWRQTS